MPGKVVVKVATKIVPTFCRQVCTMIEAALLTFRWTVIWSQVPGPRSGTVNVPNMAD